MMKIYAVEFEVHKNCIIYKYQYFCIAKNKKEACEIAKSNWKRKEHQFHLEAHYTGIDSEGHERTLGIYHCVSSKAWRINGRNLYVG